MFVKNAHLWGLRMGKAMVIFKIFSDPEKIDVVENTLRELKLESVKFQDLKREPIGFGIEVIRVGFIVPDKTDGLMPELEKQLSLIDGVNQVEVDGVTLVS